MKRLLAVLAGLVAAGCHGADPASRPVPAAASASAAAASAPIAVDAAPVVEKVLDVVVQFPGELAPYEQVDVFARANGFVAAVLVDRGTVVKKGQLLARLEAPELASQRAEAEAKVAADKSTVDRLRAADKQTPGAVAGHDVELAEAALRGSSARAAALRSMESYLVVAAPFDGVVTERDVHPGALVGPAAAGKTPMFKMESVAKLRLTVAVPEDQVSAVAAGTPVEFVARAWPGRKFTGQIARVAHAVETRTRTMPIELDVDNADGALASGMYVSVSWHAKRPGPTAFVPATSVVQSTDKTFVVRLRDGKANPVTVSRGVVSGGEVEVFGNLHAGDVVAKRGSEEMKAGRALTIREAKP